MYDSLKEKDIELENKYKKMELELLTKERSIEKYKEMNEK